MQSKYKGRHFLIFLRCYFIIESRGKAGVCTCSLYMTEIIIHFISGLHILAMQYLGRVNVKNILFLALRSMAISSSIQHKIM